MFLCHVKLFWLLKEFDLVFDSGFCLVSGKCSGNLEMIYFIEELGWIELVFVSCQVDVFLFNMQ